MTFDIRFSDIQASLEEPNSTPVRVIRCAAEVPHRHKLETPPDRKEDGNKGGKKRMKNLLLSRGVVASSFVLVLGIAVGEHAQLSENTVGNLIIFLAAFLFAPLFYRPTGAMSDIEKAKYLNLPIGKAVSNTKKTEERRVVSGVFYLLAALLTISVVQALINGTLFLDIEKPGTFMAFLGVSAAIGFLHFSLRWMLSPSTFPLRSIFCIMAAWLAAPLFFLLWGVA